MLLQRKGEVSMKIMVPMIGIVAVALLVYYIYILMKGEEK